MPLLARSHRRCRAAALVVGAIAARPVAAAPPIDRQAEALIEAGDPLAAARLFARELAALPEDFDRRARRNGLAVKAVNAFTLAFEADPSRCDAAAEGVALADAYRGEFLAVYGAVARGADEHVGMTELRDELDRLRRDHGCISAEAPAARPEPRPVDPPAVRPSPPIDPPPLPADVPTNDRRGLVAGVAVSGALTGVLLATTLGAGLSRAREPFTGAAYQDIYAAAKASRTDGIAGNEVGHDASTDMCAAGREVGNDPVIAACDTWDRLGRVTIAAGVATGVFAVTTAALAGVLVRDKRRQRALARLRAHRPALAAAPSGRGGLRLTLQWQF